MSGGDRQPLRVVIGAGTVEPLAFILPYRILIENGTTASARGVIVSHFLGQTPDEPPVEVDVRPGGVNDIELRVPLGAHPKRLAVLLRADRLSYNAEVIVPALEAAFPVTLPPDASQRLPPAEPAPLATIPRDEPVPIATTPVTYTVRRSPAMLPALAFAVLAGASAGATLLGGAALLRPQIAELAPPSPVVAGSRIDIPYRVTGVGRARYRIDDAAGTIDSGALPGHDGLLRIDVPAAVHGRSLAISVDVAGPFGSAQRSATTRLLVAPVARAPAVLPHISLVAVDRSVVTPGEDLHVTYHVDPPSGDVAIVDSFGDALASTPLVAAGRATLRVPLHPGAHDLALVVRAGSGSTAVESRIPLALTPAAPVLPGSVAGPAAGNAGLDVRDRRVSGGEEIVVNIDVGYDALRLELFDAAHRAVSAVALGPGLREAALIAPHVTRVTAYTLEATELQGTAQATSIFPITVLPSAHTP